MTELILSPHLTTVDSSGCITWNGLKSKDGYAIWSRNGKLVRAHRYIYINLKGETELVIDHLCKNRACINIDHLEAVTVAENTRRGKSAKLTLERVNIIKKMYKSGLYSQSALGRLFGVGQDHISRILSGKYWRTQ